MAGHPFDQPFPELDFSRLVGSEAPGSAAAGSGELGPASQGWPDFSQPLQGGDGLLRGAPQPWSWPAPASLATSGGSLPGNGPLLLQPGAKPNFHLQPPAVPLPDSGGGASGGARRRGSTDAPSARPSSPAQEGKSFKQLHAERNKQAQRRFRARQKEKMQELQAKAAKLAADKAEAERRKHLLSSACQLRDEELAKVRQRQAVAAEAEEDELSRAFTGAVTLTFQEGAPINLTPEQIKALSEQELAKFWSTYVKELAVLLVAVEGAADPPPPVVARIQELVQRELLFLYVRAALTNMQSVKRFIAKAKIEEVRCVAGAETALNRWREVAGALQLGPEQAAAVVQLWHRFVGQADALTQERRAIHARIAATAHAGDCAHAFAAQYLQAHQEMEALRKNLRQEHVCIHEFLVEWYLQRLTPVQVARAVVRSFPFYPDIPAIAAWVAIGAQDPLALSRLAVIEATAAASPSSSS